MKNSNKKNKKRMIIFICLVLVVTIAIISYSFIYFKLLDTEKNVAYGKISFDNNEHDVVALNGKWRFVWNELLDYEQMKTIKQVQEVPGMWTNYILDDGTKPSSYGYATFMITVDNAEKNKEYMLHIPTFGTSANIFIDDNLIYQAGKVAKSKEQYQMEFDVDYILFTAPDDEFDIVIQVSNFDYARGGIWLPVKIAEETDMRDYKSFRTSYEYFVLGILFISFIIGIILTVLNYKNHLLHSFCTAVILVTLYHITNGDKLILQWFDSISLETIVKIQYIVMFLLPAVWTGYIYNINNNKAFRNLFKILVIQSTVMSIFAIFAPISILTRTTYYGNVIIYIYIVLFISALLKHAVNGDFKAIILLLSGLILSICSVHDLLYGATIITSKTEIIVIGFLIAVFVLGMLAVENIIREMETAQMSKVYQQAYLNAQIKPHFIFNALNTITSAIAENPNKAEELICQLSIFMRSTIDVDNLSYTVPLSREIETTKAYAKIETERFNNIKILFDVENIDNILLPPMTLQPLVENAVKHGLRKKKTGGIIRISGEMHQSYYRLIVWDDGVGIDEERLDFINEKLREVKTIDAMSYDSIGLVNVNMRLMRLYEKGLEITSEEGSGTKVIVRIPKK